MPLYRCTGCGCAENTGLTDYWIQKLDNLPVLCSACTPSLGTWHGRFPQESAVGMLIDGRGFLWRPQEIMQMPKDATIVGIVQEEA
jgi:hypothetical protein